MILSREAIEERLTKGQIFKQGTWDPSCLREASYVLRVAPDGLMLGGKPYRPGKESVEGDFEINPGEIAILSTIERLQMPDDLVGKIGLRFDYASIGLTGLTGIQVDPFFGWGSDDERLYIRVANLGNESIPIPRGSGVFTFELHTVLGKVPEPTKPRTPMWYRIQENIAGQREPSWSYVTRVQVNVENVEKRLESDIKGIRDYLQPLVMFGIFLVAVTILGVALTTILNVRDTPEVYVPTWVTNWGWMVLLGTLSFAALMTGLMGVVTVVSVAIRFCKSR